MTLRTLAVAPIHPDAVAELTVPECWEDAFAMMADRMARVIGRQAGEIKVLKEDLADARGLVAAGAKALADLGAQVAGLAAAGEVMDTAVRVQGDRGAEMATAVVELAGALDILTAGVGTKFDSGAVVVRALVERVDGLEVHGKSIDSRLDAHADLNAKTVDAVDRLQSVPDSIQKIIETVTANDERTVNAIETITSTRSRLDALAGDVDTLGEQFGEKVEAIRNDIAVTRKDDWETLETDFGDVRGLIAELADTVTSIVKRQGEDGIRVGQVEEVVTGFGATTVTIAREVRMIDDAVKTGTATIAATEEQSRDALRRVTIALDQMPAGFMIDQAGVLNRVNRAGDVTPLGTVVGHAKDGRDGTTPAQIVAVRVDGERLVMTMSDRSEVGCQFPRVAVEVPPAVPVDVVDPVTLGYLSKDTKVRRVQVEDMVKMREAGKNYKTIAAKYAISERQSARLINDEKPAKS